MEKYNFVSFFGIFGILLLTWLFSSNKRTINWKAVGWGLGLQLIFAAVIFQIPLVSTAFIWLNGVIVNILDSGSAGAKFVFGRLAFPPGTVEGGQESLGFFLAFQGLPAIIFFSSVTAILYFYNVLPWLIRQFARLFNRLMGISGAEALSAASNIFLGVESALTIQPHIKKMTRSELCTVLTCGMATVASNVLAVYVFFLRERFPAIAAHLISASVLSAPAALACAKIIFPETETPETLGKDVKFHYDKPVSIYAAIIQGAQTGLHLVLSIAALLIAVLGLVAIFDMALSNFGSWVNNLFHLNLNFSLTGLLSYVFYLPTLLIGVPRQDVWHIAQIIASRAIVTELTAYQNLANLIETGALSHGRSVVIAAYALCGFAHVASIGIFVGGVSALAPERTHDIAKSGFRALLAATMACLLTACVAGTFYNQSSLLFSVY